MSTDPARERSREVNVLVDPSKVSPPRSIQAHTVFLSHAFGAVTRIHVKMEHMVKVDRQIFKCQLVMS